VDAAGAADKAEAQLADGAALLAALAAAGANLAHQSEAIDALNVFPVPDGDTGKNMTLTMQAALDAAQAAPPAELASAGALAARLARGAVMGSRGNSGVILSQILRGFARGLGAAERFGGAELATAFREATATAYRAVQQPVEGTMLTVIRAVADAAEATVAAAETAPSGLLAVLDTGLAAAREALAHTPELLPRLREAGVVDAGGQGVVALLEGATRYAHGEAPGVPAKVVQPVTPSAAGGVANQMADFLALHEEDEVGYCTNLLILPRPQETLAYPLIRERLLALGESGVVIGDEELVKIHIHTEHPGLVLEEAVRWGELSQIRIDNMAAQVRAVSSGVQASVGSAPAAPVASAPEQAPLAGPEVVAVASGAGLVAVLRGLGATRIVSGGQTMNPSTEELLRAVEAAPGGEVILLPNNGNVILTAEQVTGLTTKRVAIVPARSAPQGIAALTAFNFDASLDENLAAMTEALTNMHSAEVTRAVRAATIDGLSVATGQIIGLIDGKLSVAGDNMQEVLLDLLQRMDAASAELVTIYRGADTGEDSARAMVESLAAHYPAATFELVDGGQPHYDYLLSVE
jgi:DAK2 domain fusion protein YloV